jgi:hypothetical protein
MSSWLLPGEGVVGSYGELVKRGRRGDNLTTHHIPSNAFMLIKVPRKKLHKNGNSLRFDAMSGAGRDACSTRDYCTNLK